MMKEGRKYQFSWNLIGDLQLGRPNLGPYARLEVYRLMQFTFRDVLERRFGEAVADDVFYDAGFLAGQAFYSEQLKGESEFEPFIRRLQESLREMGVGVLRIEEADLETGRLVLTVSEDLDCSGLPEMDFEVCKYDEGFIAGILEAFTGRRFQVKEVDCWCTGDRTCRFSAEAVKES